MEQYLMLMLDLADVSGELELPSHWEAYREVEEEAEEDGDLPELCFD